MSASVNIDPARYWFFDKIFSIRSKQSNKLTTESFDFGANEEEFSGEELFWGLLGLSFLGMPIIILILFVLVVVLGIILIVRRKK